MRILSEDGNVLPKVYSLNYDTWATKDIHKTRGNSCPGKTSFQLIMVIFGNVDESTSVAEKMPNVFTSLTQTT